MSRISRGSTVRFTVPAVVDAFGRVRVAGESGRGLVLDRGPDVGTFWVLPTGARDARVLPTLGLVAVAM
jgi:hypothetical protein